MKTTERNLTARFFPTAKISRIYEDGKWVYTTDEDLSDYTGNDLKYFLSSSQSYWKK